MKIIRLFVIAATLALCAHAQQPASHAPRIAWDPPVIDFGVTDGVLPIDAVFTVRNTGDLTLEITRIQPSCGCTVADISSRSIKPGESAKLTARMNLLGRPPGPQEKHIVIECNDPQQPTVLLALRGVLKVDVMAEPVGVMMGQIKPETPGEAVVKITNSGKQPLAITGTEVTSPRISASIETTEVGRVFNVHIKTVPPLQPGPFDAVVSVRTDRPSRPLLAIPVAGYVMGELAYAPMEIPVAPSATPVSHFIIVRPGTRPLFKIESVEVPDPDILYEIQPAAPSGYRVMLTFRKITTAMHGKAIRIQTDAPSMKSIYVPIRVVGP